MLTDPKKIDAFSLQDTGKIGNVWGNKPDWADWRLLIMDLPIYTLAATGTMIYESSINATNQNHINFVFKDANKDRLCLVDDLYDEEQPWTNALNFADWLHDFDDLFS